MKAARVVLIGPECTGKTWLAGELAALYGVAWSREFAREYVDRHGTLLSFADVDPIGRGQKQGEDAASLRAQADGAPIVVLDTDLVSTAVYSRHYYDDCPAWIEQQAARRQGELYLLHYVDVPWVEDGRQREQPERRQELFERFRATLARSGRAGRRDPGALGGKATAGRAGRRRAAAGSGARGGAERIRSGRRGQPGIQTTKRNEAKSDRKPTNRRTGFLGGIPPPRPPEYMDERLKAELIREIQEFIDRQWPRAVSDGAATITQRRLQLASAVLMVSVVRADLESRQDEHRALERAVGRALDLHEEAAALVVRVAEEALGRGVSFAAVLVRLQQECTLDQKRQLVESLWRIAFADAELAGHEEYLVRKIAGQLGLSTADLVETKVRAREDFLKEEL